MTKPAFRFPTVVSLAALLGLALVSPSAGAQQAPAANCPPGSWFCGEGATAPAAAPAAAAPAAAAPPPAAPPPATDALQPLPSKEAPKDGASPPVVVYQPQPPVVVYQPAPPPPVMVVQGTTTETPPAYKYSPRDDYPKKNEWGLNLHLLGALMGKDASPNAGMGGLGFGLRYKPVPFYGIEGDLDFVGGRDYQGRTRGESAFTLNNLFFVNPKSKAQVYFLVGFGWSGARILDACTGGLCRDSTTYSYFGGQAGVGLEWRLSKHFALNGDLRGFVRGRTDKNAAYEPEFRDGAGRTTNTSGGGLLTAGMTFYF